MKRLRTITLIILLIFSSLSAGVTASATASSQMVRTSIFNPAFNTQSIFLLNSLGIDKILVYTSDTEYVEYSVLKTRDSIHFNIPSTLITKIETYYQPDKTSWVAGPYLYAGKDKLGTSVIGINTNTEVPQPTSTPTPTVEPTPTDYSGGLLDGLPLMYGSDETMSTFIGTISTVTDNNEATFFDMLGANNRNLFYELPTAVNLTGFRVSASKSSNLVSLIFFGANKNQLYSVNGAAFDYTGKLNLVSLTGVKYVLVANTGYATSYQLNELNIYGIVPTPTPTATPVPTSTPSPTATPKPTATPEQTGDRAILTITLVNGIEKEYDLPIAEVDAFLKWYDSRDAGRGPGSYAIDKHSNNKGPFSKRKDYVVFDKILTFEVSEYTSK